jgi:hypothetical protein
MNTYTVYFEIFGKKMKVEVKAVSQDAARNVVRQKLIFHKVVLEETDRTVEELMNLFGIK